MEDIETVSCVKFQDITNIMEEYMKDVGVNHYDTKYFQLKDPPDEYPDFL